MVAQIGTRDVLAVALGSLGAQSSTRARRRVLAAGGGRGGLPAADAVRWRRRDGADPDLRRSGVETRRGGDLIPRALAPVRRRLVETLGGEQLHVAPQVPGAEHRDD